MVGVANLPPELRPLPEKQPNLERFRVRDWRPEWKNLRQLLEQLSPVALEVQWRCHELFNSIRALEETWWSTKESSSPSESEQQVEAGEAGLTSEASPGDEELRRKVEAESDVSLPEEPMEEEEGALQQEEGHADKPGQLPPEVEEKLEGIARLIIDLLPFAKQLEGQLGELREKLTIQVGGEKLPLGLKFEAKDREGSYCIPLPLAVLGELAGLGGSSSILSRWDLSLLEKPEILMLENDQWMVAVMKVTIPAGHLVLNDPRKLEWLFVSFGDVEGVIREFANFVERLEVAAFLLKVADYFSSQEEMENVVSIIKLLVVRSLVHGGKADMPTALIGLVKGLEMLTGVSTRALSEAALQAAQFQPEARRGQGGTSEVPFLSFKDPHLSSIPEPFRQYVSKYFSGDIEEILDRIKEDFKEGMEGSFHMADSQLPIEFSVDEQFSGWFPRVALLEYLVERFVSNVMRGFRPLGEVPETEFVIGDDAARVHIFALEDGTLAVVGPSRIPEDKRIVLDPATKQKDLAQLVNFESITTGGTTTALLWVLSRLRMIGGHVRTNFKVEDKSKNKPVGGVTGGGPGEEATEDKLVLEVEQPDDPLPEHLRVRLERVAEAIARSDLLQYFKEGSIAILAPIPVEEAPRQET